MTEGAVRDRRFQVVLFCDAVGSCTRIGEAQEVALPELFEDLAVFREICSRHNGTTKKSTGDGLMMLFGSAVDAVRAALEMQRAQRQQTEPQMNFRHRFGMDLGELELRDSDAFGNAANVAARLQSTGGPGCIVLTRGVRDAVKNSLAIQSEAMGPLRLKGVPDPVTAFKIPEVYGLQASIVMPKPRQTVPQAASPNTPQIGKRKSHSYWLTAALFIALALVVVLTPWKTLSAAVASQVPSVKKGPPQTSQKVFQQRGRTAPAQVPPVQVAPVARTARQRERSAVQVASVSSAKEVLDELRDEHLRRYDFAGYKMAAEANPELGPDLQQQAAAESDQFQMLYDRLMTRLSEGSSHPLTIRGSTTGGSFQYYNDEGGTLVQEADGAVQNLDLLDLPPSRVLLMMAAAVESESDAAAKALGRQAISDFRSCLRRMKAL